MRHEQNLRLQSSRASRTPFPQGLDKIRTRIWNPIAHYRHGSRTQSLRIGPIARSQHNGLLHPPQKDPSQPAFPEPGFAFKPGSQSNRVPMQNHLIKPPSNQSHHQKITVQRSTLRWGRNVIKCPASVLMRQLNRLPAVPHERLDLASPDRSHIGHP